MSKVAIVVLADTETHESLGRVFLYFQVLNRFLYAKVLDLNISVTLNGWEKGFSQRDRFAGTRDPQLGITKAFGNAPVLFPHQSNIIKNPVRRHGIFSYRYQHLEYPGNFK